jgi:hypothetical protein
MNVAYSIGRNTRVEVQKTLATAQALTAVTLANPGVITYGGSLTTGDVIVISSSIAGMTELAGQTVRVANVSASPSTAELESLDTTLFGALTATSSFTVVSAWSTLGIARSVNAGGTAPNRIDATTLLDSEKQYLFGQSESPEITVDCISDPLTEAALLVEAAARTNTPIAFRITMSTGAKRIFGGYVSLPSESIPLGELVTASFSVTQIRRRLAYAS